MDNNLKIFAVLVALVATIAIAGATDYCQIAKKRCGGQDHAMCVNGKAINYEYPPDLRYEGIWPVRRGKLSQEEKNEILNAHNKIRRYVAAGKEIGAKAVALPPAKHMPDLVWDDELEIMAQTSANDWKYYITRNMYRCPHTSSDLVGQNAHYSQIHTKGNDFGESIKDILDKWLYEVRFFHAKEVKKYRYNGAAKHFTQMIWGATTKIGCGWQHFKSPNFLLPDKRNRGGFHNHFFCYYATEGNRENQPVYQIAD